MYIRIAARAVYFIHIYRSTLFTAAAAAASERVGERKIDRLGIRREKERERDANLHGYVQ